MLSLLVTVFAVSLAAATAAAKLPLFVSAYYLAASLVTFALYARDKVAAVDGAWRTRERTLHLFSLLGGWPGAAIAQSVLHHKSRKASFRCLFLVTVTVNCVVLVWLSLPLLELR